MDNFIKFSQPGTAVAVELLEMKDSVRMAQAGGL